MTLRQPPMPAAVEITVTVRNDDQPVVNLAFVDVLGEVVEMQLTSDVALDLLVGLAQFTRQVHLLDQVHGQ